LVVLSLIGGIADLCFFCRSGIAPVHVAPGAKWNNALFSGGLVIRKSDAALAGQHEKARKNTVIRQNTLANQSKDFASPGSVNQCRLTTIFWRGTMARCIQDTTNMLKLRLIGLSDYAVLDGSQRIGRIRLATERMLCVWLWSVTIHLTGGLPIGSARDLDTAKAEFRTAWEGLKAKISPEQLAAAYRAMNVRDDG